MIEFVWWGFFLLLPLPVLARRYLQPADSSDDFALRTPFYQNWLQLYQGCNTTPEKGYLLRLLLLSLIWLLLIIAVAKPQYVGDPIELPASGRDLLIAVDISGSMEATDLKLKGKKATRLAVVKSVLNDFIERRKGDRIGLILFGEQAYLQTPLTFDRSTVIKMLNEATIGLAGASRTAIGDGIGLAVKRLRERKTDSRVLILLTDGQNNTGAVDPLKAAQLAKQVGVKIYTIGVGADKMVIESFFGQRTLNPSKDLDEKTLIAVSKTTNGQYFRAKDAEQLEKIYEILDQIEPVEDNPEIFRPVKSLFYWPLGIALLFAFILASEKMLAQKILRLSSLRKSTKPSEERLSDV